MTTISVIHNAGARIGHQVNNYFSVLGYCTENNINFNYTEFLGNSQSWNNVLNFHQIYNTINDDNQTLFDLNTEDILALVQPRPKPQTLISLYDQHRDKLFNRYYLKKSPYQSQNNICIHIRRGDVNNVNHPGRFLPISYYTKILSSIYQNQQVYVVSESNLEECSNDFKEYNTIILNSLSDIESFYYMVNSSIFIASKGGFSHLAHILGYSKCYYPQHWCVYRKDATAKLKTAL